MSNRVYVNLIRKVSDEGEMNFSTNLNEETVSKWLNDNETLPYDFQEDVNEEDWENDDDHHYIFNTYRDNNKFTFESGEGDDDDCPYDGHIKDWIRRSKKKGTI